MNQRKSRKRNITQTIFVVLIMFTCFSSYAFQRQDNVTNHQPTSTSQQALEFLSESTFPDSSGHWPNVKPGLFINNLKVNIQQPISIYPGEGTYFCAYSAITYLLLQDDPLGYAKFVTALYKNGTAEYRGIVFTPSASIKSETGKLKYKGIMDIHPADQMWFLTLADHFKGYLNIFNRSYESGDESSFWASVNYAKFNRMAQKLLYYDIAATGTDFFRPRINNIYEYLTKRLAEGHVVLYINNRIVHKKNHTNLKLAVPTHYIALESITKVGDVITLIYWDNGGKTLLQLSPAFLKRILYGITVFTKVTGNDG